MPMTTLAYDISVNGIYYDLNTSNKSASVTYKTSSYNSYYGEVVIPGTIICNGDLYTVSSISENAFRDCTNLDKVNIPSTIQHMGNYAFLDCTSLSDVEIESIDSWLAIKFSNLYANPTYYSHRLSINDIIIEDVEIPESFSAINDYTFYNCSYIQSVRFSDSLKTIGDFSFCNCTGLTTLVLPNSVLSIGNYSFNGCSSLKSVTIGSGISEIPLNGFNGVNPTKAIWLSNTPPLDIDLLKADINYAINNSYPKEFVKYEYLNSIFEVNGVKYVPVNPSERTCDVIDCSYTNENSNCAIPSSVVYKDVEMDVLDICNNAFKNNSYIIDIQLNNSGFIGNSAFKSCQNLSSVIIKSNVKEIKDQAFNDCGSLKSLTIESQEQSLLVGSNGTNPLFHVSPIEFLSLNRDIVFDSALGFEYSPFKGNSCIEKILISGATSKINDYLFFNCTGLKKLEIDGDVEYIGNSSFDGCVSLTECILGDKITSIGTDAFSNCTLISSLISKSTTPPNCLSNALQGINKWNCTLYVPALSISEYQEAYQWKDFFFIKAIEEMEANVPIVNKDKSLEYQIFNLNGIRVNKQWDILDPGLYILKMNRTSKIVLKGN